jgi:hypothetical protein
VDNLDASSNEDKGLMSSVEKTIGNSSNSNSGENIKKNTIINNNQSISDKSIPKSKPVLIKSKTLLIPNAGMLKPKMK